MQIGERMADDFELSGAQFLDRKLGAFDVFAHRCELAVKLVIIAAFFAAERLRAGTALLAQEKQQLELLLDLELAFDLIDLEKEFPPLGLQQIMRVDRAVTDSCVRNEIAESKFIGDSCAIALMKSRVNCHENEGQSLRCFMIQELLEYILKPAKCQLFISGLFTTESGFIFISIA